MTKLYKSFLVALLLSVASLAFAGEPFAVVELFTSEGCSSCPSADAFFTDLTVEVKNRKAKVYTLGFHVGYWNDLGWVDPFSQEAFTDRQHAYANINKSKTVYTPQLVVNGQNGFSGNNFELAQDAINLALSKQSPAELKLSRLGYDEKKRRVSFSYIASGDLKNTDLKIALVAGNLISNVATGENAGQRLQHTNTVQKFESKSLIESQGIVNFEIPRKFDLQNAALVVFIQNSQTLVILAADGFDL